MASQAATKQKAAEYAAKGEYDLAIEEYNKLLTENDNDASVHNLLGDIYTKRNDKEQAILEYERAVEIYSEDAFYTNAIAVCKKILRADSDKASVYEDMASLYAKQGLLGEAVANYKEFGDRMKARGDMERVFVSYQKIKELMPKKIDVRLSLVDMYLARNRNDDAVAELKDVANLFREQDKIEDAEGVESRVRMLGGRIDTPKAAKPEAKPAKEPVAETAPKPAEEPKKDEKRTDNGFPYFDQTPPGLKEPGQRAAAAAETAQATMEPPKAAAGLEEEMAGSEIKFEQTISDLEGEKGAAAAAAPKAAVLEPEPPKMKAPAPEPERVQTAGPPPVKPVTEEELVRESAKSRYEPIFKSAPTDMASYIELGDLCLSIGSADEAVEYFYKAADAFFEEKMFDKAFELFLRIAELRPLELRPRQKLAQIAQKKNDNGLMVEAFIALGDCLTRRGATSEAESVYRRVLAIDPANEIARSKVGPEVQVSAAAAPKPSPAKPKPEPAPAKKSKMVVEEEPAEAAGAGTVSFDDMVKEVDSGEARKFKVEQEPEKREGLLTMAELLQEFKTGVEENIPAGDLSSHYDLGITYKEMGLLDEAIEEFTKASKGPEMAAKAFEMLGRVFLEQGENEKAVLHLKAGLAAKVAQPEERIGLFYHVGRAYEALGDKENAYVSYLKVIEFDPEFEDAEARMTSIKPEEVKPVVEAPSAARAETKAAKDRAAKKKGKISYV